MAFQRCFLHSWDSVSQLESIKCDINTDNAPSSTVAIIKHYPMLKLCLLRIYVPTRSSQTYSENTSYTLCTVPEEYRPNSLWALSVYGGGTSAQASVNSSGEVKVISRGGNITSGYVIYISGSWFVDN